MGERIVVIGGTAAGPKSASKIRRDNPNAEVIMFQKIGDLSVSSCGLPYYVGDTFPDRELLIGSKKELRDVQFFEKRGIDARIHTEVTKIDRLKKEVHYTELDSGRRGMMGYDRCVIATGATAKKPQIPGIDLTGVSTLHSMSDSDYFRRVRDEQKITDIVIIGGGFIGVEGAEALKQDGVNVTIIGTRAHLLPFLHDPLAEPIEAHLKEKGVDVITGTSISSFNGVDGQLSSVTLLNGKEIPAGAALVAIGVAPVSKLAKDAGLDVAPNGGIMVNQYMETSDPNIYAAGDCISVHHILTGEQVVAPMGDLANLQGRVVGINAAYGEQKATFPGTIQTVICRAFDMAAGGTGLTEAAAIKAGYDVITVIAKGHDKPGFMGAKSLISAMVVDRDSEIILGYQVVGIGDVSRQTAIGAMAVTAKMRVDQMVNLDLPYAPPFSPAIDHFILSAHIVAGKLAKR